MRANEAASGTRPRVHANETAVARLASLRARELARLRDERFVGEAITVLVTAEAHLFHSVTRDTT